MILASKALPLASLIGSTNRMLQSTTIGSHPLFVLTSRKFQSYGVSNNSSIMLLEKCGYTSSANAQNVNQLLARWKKNFSRLYARRMLELAAAAAAAEVLRSKCEAIDVVSKPIEWKDWERKDWDNTALASVGDTKWSRFCMATKRIIDLVVLASPFMIIVPLSFVSDRVHKASWDYALFAIEKAGPTWIKLTQWASTRQDLFTPKFLSNSLNLKSTYFVPTNS